MPARGRHPIPLLADSSATGGFTGTTLISIPATEDSAAEIFIHITPGVQRFEFFRLLQRITHGEEAESGVGAAGDPGPVRRAFTTSPVCDAAGHH
ncbi:hypothetical protein ACWDKQ_09405 [Saccharopolyspora sp. NPDC000995]